MNIANIAIFFEACCKWKKNLPNSAPFFCCCCFFGFYHLQHHILQKASANSIYKTNNNKKNLKICWLHNLFNFIYALLLVQFISHKICILPKKKINISSGNSLVLFLLLCCTFFYSLGFFETSENWIIYAFALK